MGKDKKDKSASSKKTADASSSSTGKVKPAQQINVRHILCEKQARSLLAVAALQSGSKFDDVAREYSEDKARAGGALGWKSRGDLDPKFEEVAFELEASSVAKPVWREVRTGFGYHVLMVEGRK